MFILWHRLLDAMPVCVCVPYINARLSERGKAQMKSHEIAQINFHLWFEMKTSTNTNTQPMTRANVTMEGFELSFINLIVHIYFIYIYLCVRMQCCERKPFLIHFRLKLCQIVYDFNWVTQYIDPLQRKVMYLGLHLNIFVIHYYCVWAYTPLGHGQKWCYTKVWISEFGFFHFICCTV